MKHRKQLVKRTENQYTRHLMGRIAKNVTAIAGEWVNKACSAAAEIVALSNEFKTLNSLEGDIPSDTITRIMDLLVVRFSSYKRDVLADALARTLGYSEAFVMVTENMTNELRVAIKSKEPISLHTFIETLNSHFR